MSDHRRRGAAGKKRKRAARACTLCKKSKSSCSGERPCFRCKKMGRQHECMDIPPLDIVRHQDSAGWRMLVDFHRSRSPGSASSKRTDSSPTARSRDATSASQAANTQRRALSESNGQLKAQLDMVLSRLRLLQPLVRHPEALLGRASDSSHVAVSRWTLPGMVLNRCNSGFRALAQAPVEGVFQLLQWPMSPPLEPLRQALQLLEEGDAVAVTISKVITEGIGAGRQVTSLVCKPRTSGGQRIFNMFSMLEALPEPGFGQATSATTGLTPVSFQRSTDPPVGSEELSVADLDIPDELLHEQLLAIGDSFF